MIENGLTNQTTDKRPETNLPLITEKGKVTTLNSSSFSLIIGTSIEEPIEFFSEEDSCDYPESLEAENSEYDSWLG